MMNRFLMIAVLAATTLLAHAQSKPHHPAIDPTKVDIVRDSFGVPHIFAKTDAEVAYGLAWATCEDDFKTLQWGLLAGKGMMGRLQGVDGAKIDYAVQLLRAKETVDAAYDTAFSDHFKGMLEAYIQAVNLYAKTHPNEVLVKKAFPAEPKDVVKGFMLSICLMSGVDGPLGDIVSGKIATAKTQNRGGIGSNGIAFNSKITADGSVYLDINSHQPIEGPLSWYEAHLCSEEGWNVIGGLFHGAICVLHGTNENLGWAHTYNDFDLIDVYQLTINPNNKNEYWFDGHWEQLEKGKAKLCVNLAKHKDKHRFVLTVHKAVWWSKYGATLQTKNGTYAVRLPGNQVVGAPEQWFMMDKAKNFTEFRKALDMQQIGRMTIIYGDKYDTIYHISNGLVPKRNPHYNWSLLVPGDTSATLWTGYQPESALPQVLNPECGYVFNMNNSPFECTGMGCNPNIKDYDPTMGFDLKKTNRSVRMYELMDQLGKKKVSWDDFLRIKYDDQLPDSLVFQNGIDLNHIMHLDAAKYPDIADAIDNISTCPRNGDTTNVKVTILVEAVYKMLANEGKYSNDYAHDTAAQEKLMVESIREAKTDMLKNFGTINVPLGQTQKLVRGNKVLAVPGLPDVIRACYTQPWKDGMRKMFVGESYIQLVKFNKTGLPQIQSVSAFGASSHVGSPHSVDQMDMFVNKQLKTESLDKKYVYKHAERVYHPGL